MPREPVDVDAFVAAVQGRRVVALARVYYQYRGEVAEDDGVVELALDDGTIWLLDSAPSGDLLKVTRGAWIDPFAGELSEENRAYVEEHGCWRRFDVSGQAPFAQLVDQVVVDARLLRNQFDDVAGVRLSTSSAALWFVVTGDECHVHWAHPLGYTLAPRRPGAR